MVSKDHELSGLCRKLFELFLCLTMWQQFVFEAGRGFSGFRFMSTSGAAKDKFRLWLCLGGRRRRTFPAVGAIVRVVGALAPTIRAHHHLRTYSFRPQTNWA
jgi:hypothetical protein